MTWLMLCDQLETDLKERDSPRWWLSCSRAKQSDYVKCHECAPSQTLP